MAKITKLEPRIPPPPSRKKVAAYARVSMESERLHHSLSSQISYYSELIQGNPEWEYAGVYADEGITGTEAKKRAEFQRMLADCEAGKIDIILTKSISRFARNTVDLLETVRRLKELGISVRFEKENIDSLSGEGELMLTVLASFAQEESRSISENVKWGIRKRYGEGIPNGRFHIYGYRWEEDHLVVEPEEAKTVKLIYANYLSGISAETTGKQLEEAGVKSPYGKPFSSPSIRAILSNITYTGNLLLQREYISNPITKKCKKNCGELPQYFVENTHEAIIPMETYLAVQAERERRRELGVFANPSIKTTCFTSKIKCGICGASYRRCGRRQKKNSDEVYYIWKCQTYCSGGKAACPSKNIPEITLKKICAETLGVPEFDGELFLREIEKIVTIGGDRLDFHFKDGRVVQKTWKSTAHRDCWTDELRRRASEYLRRNPPARDGVTCLTSKVICGECGANFNRQVWINAAGEKKAKWFCSAHKKDKNACSMSRTVDEDIIKNLSAIALGLDDFDESAFKEKVARVIITGAGTLTVELKNGESKDYVFSTKKTGTPWTEERRLKQTEAIRNSFTEERRREISERMKKIRSEKYWNSKRK